MNSKLQTIDSTIGKLLATLKRFPLAMISAYLFAIILIVLATFNHQEKELLEHYHILNKISLIASIGFFLFTTLRLISRNFLLILLGFVLLVSYYIYLPDNIRNLHKLGMEYPVILFSLLSLMISAPYLTHSTSNIKFWNWAKHIILSLLLSVFFGLILFLGMSGGLSISEKLFELEKTYYYTEQIGLFTIGIFGTYFFLSQLPKYPRLFPMKAYNNVENIFTKFILTPLFALYFIILYTYTAKIIFLGEWPKGVVSMSILLFSALSILTYLFWTPLWSKKNEKYKNFFWFAILFQTFVLGIALYLRVEPYGWTSNRYMIAVLGIWLFVISLYFIVNKKASYRAIFISLPIVLMLTLFSPISASNVAKQSQQEKLKKLVIMEENLSEESNLSLRYNISSSISYLYKEHGIDSLLPIIPEIVTSYQNREQNLSNNCAPANIYGNFPNYATKALGFEYIERWKWEQHTQIINDSRFENKEMTKRFQPFINSYQNNQTEVKGYDWLLYFDYFNIDTVPNYCPPPYEKPSVPKQQYTLKTHADSIVIKEKNRVLATINIEKFIHKIITTTPKKDKTDTPQPSYYQPRYNNSTILPIEDFTYHFTNQHIRVKIIFNSIEVSKKDKIILYGGKILINKK